MHGHGGGLKATPLRGQGLYPGYGSKPGQGN